MKGPCERIRITSTRGMITLYSHMAGRVASETVVLGTFKVPTFSNLGVLHVQFCFPGRCQPDRIGRFLFLVCTQKNNVRLPN